MTDAYRQEVFNVLLVQLLHERGVVSTPESIIRGVLEQGWRAPDIIVDFFGLRLVVEGEVADRPGAEERALASTRRRVEEGIAHVGVAAIYPAELREAAFADLKSRLASCELRIAIMTESEEGGFSKGNVDYLESTLRQTFEQLIHEDIVGRAAAVLDAGVERFASVVTIKPGAFGRIAEALGIRALPEKQRASEEPLD